MLKTKTAYLASRKIKQPPEGVFCNYSHRICMQNRLDGFEYCLKHILEDKIAPYKQCNYISNKSGKRCPNAAPKADKKDGFCINHARKAATLRQKAHRKRQAKETPETILEELEHYNKSSAAADVAASSTISSRKSARSNIETTTSRVLDSVSSDDTDTEPPLVDQAWRGDGDSDAESVDSEQEDLLKYADVYTAEEVALITRDKLIRLQSLYIDQFKRLQHELRERRRKYLQAVRQEREALGSIHLAKDDPAQRSKYKRFLAMKKYHRRFGSEALLHRQSKERRIAASEGQTYVPPSYPKCVHGDGTPTKCDNRVMPLSKFCQEHILEDRQQVLFRHCSYGNGACSKAVAATMSDPRCALHPSADALVKRLPEKEESTDDSHCLLDVENIDLPLLDNPNDQHLGTLGASLQAGKLLQSDSALLEAEESISLEAAGVPRLNQPPIDTGLHSVTEDMDLT